jgi:hypothetical protein
MEGLVKAKLIEVGGQPLFSRLLRFRRNAEKVSLEDRDP